MEGTRLRILEHLQQENQTVGGLATIMGLAPATVRRHLDILQRDHLIPPDRGRSGISAQILRSHVEIDG